MAGNRVISAVLTLKDKDFGSTVKKSASAMGDLERKTRHSGNTVKNFGTSATSSFKKVATGAASIVTAIGVVKGLSMAFGLVKSSIGSAFDRIDVMENFERTMTTLTGSSEKTAEALEKTRDAVTGTGYGLDTAAKSVQNFVTRGMEIDKATETMATWGDAVAFYGDGSSEQFETVADAIGKMYSSGKVNMQQMNRLTDSGIDAVGMYAKAVGRDIPSVQKDLSKGAVSAEEFLDVVQTAMMEGTNGVENIAGAAKEAGSSWKNTFANMRASVTRGVEDVIMNIDKMLTENGLPDMRSMVANFGSKFEGVIKSVSGKIPALTTTVLAMYEGVKPAIDWLKDVAFPAVKEELVGMYEAAKPGLEWIANEGFPLIVDAVVLAVDGFTTLYNFVSENLPLITPIVAGVVATVLAFKVGIVAITTAKAAWATVTSVLTIATGLLNGTLALSPLGWVAIAIGVVIAAGVALYMNFDKVKQAASWLWEKLLDNPMLAIVAGPFGAFIAAGITIYKNFDKIKDAFQRFKDAISNFKLPAWVSSIGSTIGNAVSSVKELGAAKPSASYAVGTNAVPHDMVAQIHKGEMIVPATQSRNLRKQGVTIDNIDKGGTAKTKSTGTVKVASNPTQTNTDTSSNLLAQLVQVIKNMPKGDVNININGHNLTVDQIVGELVRKLEAVNFNMA